MLNVSIHQPGQKGNLNPALPFRPALISLKDVQIYLADRLASISRHLTTLHLCSFGEFDTGCSEPKMTEGDRAQMLPALEGIKREAAVIFLPMTAKMADRVIPNVKAGSAEDLSNQISELERRFDDELAGVKFFHVKPEMLANYNNPELAGADFKNAFPTGNRELIEAGNCLALDRFTACVFHLMRALEAGLTTLETRLGIVAPPKGAENTWGKILGRIKDKLDQNDKTPPVDWAKDREFYWKAYSFLQSAKMPIRDATVHNVKSVYDEGGAASVFTVTIEVLRHLAAKLSE